jgi:uncharacterized protein DUF2752
VDFIFRSRLQPSECGEPLIGETDTGSTTSLQSKRLDDPSSSADVVDRDSSVGRAEHLWVLAMALAAIAGSFILYPGTEGGLRFDVPGVAHPVQLPEVCMSRRVLGISCPGCGLTRSFCATAQGDPATAWNINPMGPILFLICLLQVPYRIVEYFGLWSQRPAWIWCRNRFYPITYLIVLGLFAQWVVRLLL